MKKETGGLFQDIEKKYHLDKCKKTEYFRRMIKEFAKNDKKLTKIENYEKMEKEGKPLNEEMRILLSRRPELVRRLDTLRLVMDIYQQSLAVEDEPLAPVTAPPAETLKAKSDEQLKEFADKAVAKLSCFFAVGRTLAERNCLTSNPLAGMSESRRKLVSEMYKDVVSLPLEEETSLAEEAKRTAGVLKKLLKPNDATNFISELAGESRLAEMKFTVNKPRQNEYGVTQAVSITSNAPKERPPEPEEVPEPKEEPVVEASKPTSEREVAAEKYQPPEPAPEPPAEAPQERQHDSWEDEDPGEDEPQEPQQEPQNAEEQDDDFVFPKKKEEEEEFETVVSKTDARKKAKEEEEKEKSRGGRGRRGRYRDQRAREGRDEGYRKREEDQTWRNERWGKGERRRGDQGWEVEGAKGGEEVPREDGNFRGGFRGNFRPGPRGYHRGRRGNYGNWTEHRGNRRYGGPRRNFQYD